MCKTFTWSKSQSDTLKDVVSEMPCFLPSCFIPHPIVNYFINLFLGYPCSGFFFFFLKNICFLFFFLSYLKGKITQCSLTSHSYFINLFLGYPCSVFFFFFFLRTYVSYFSFSPT